VVGPPPQELVDPVDGDELRAGVRTLVDEWWRPGGGASQWFHDPPYRRYAVLTMCRMRYTLAEGDVVSKPVAAEWALSHVAPRWHDLIRRAAARDACGYEETLAFVRDTVALASC
jgi:hypothetical protein